MRQGFVFNIVITGLLTALVAVSTMVITVPVPATEGFIHMGDSMIFLAAMTFGKKKGAFAAGVGSALADILLGYTHWALPTLIIKGIMGYAVGAIADQESEGIVNVRNSGALVVGALWMVVGYLFGGAILKGSFAVSLTSVPANMIQGFGGIALFIPIGMALKKTKYFQKYVLK